MSGKLKLPRRRILRANPGCAFCMLLIALYKKLNQLLTKSNEKQRNIKTYNPTLLAMSLMVIQLFNANNAAGFPKTGLFFCLPIRRFRKYVEISMMSNDHHKDILTPIFRKTVAVVTVATVTTVTTVATVKLF
ncbi:hypothetical protein AX774_g1901 [Zancudomyces culisetae]|uniref:Uncharacterized protein n=1 Tax=Zancudomyces culisetae TaxID=1213189 RepID=A0A1R1PUK7_ZANCU|nr:hypothetical protein AX774_g1901 [Zancudomyces culisetae]|eukprot:OMH84572.1 hypothetical protein AX774_g1901 [Zancudomyces culisetae]